MIRSNVKVKLRKKASREQCASLQALVERYAAGGPTNVPPKKFNGAEGWFPSANDKRVRLEAFKPWQLRAYGFCKEFNGRQTFFITGADPAKKQDNADQDVIEAAGKEAVRLHSTLS